MSPRRGGRALAEALFNNVVGILFAVVGAILVLGIALAVLRRLA